MISCPPFVDPDMGHYALGANRGSVARTIMSEGVRIVLVGASVGSLAAYLAARGMSSLLLAFRQLIS